MDQAGGAGAVDGAQHDGPVVEARDVADADGVLGLELEAEEVLERPGEACPPGLGRHRGQVDAVDGDAPPGRVVHGSQ